MKTYPMFAISVLFSFSSMVHAEPKPWTPSMSYSESRWRSVSDPHPRLWTFSKVAERAEYQMPYLLQADKDATLLALSLESKVREGKISQGQIVQLRGIGGSLHEVVRCMYEDVTPYFEKKPNPTLLLMMLYHFEVYCYGGDSDESWPDIIEPLQALDPAITAEAKKLAVKGIADRKAITDAEQGEAPNRR